MTRHATILLSLSLFAALSLSLLAALSPAAAESAEPLRSGLQAGESIAAIFQPLNVTGPFAGEPHCLVCENGASPVVMIFARGLSDPLEALLARLEAAVEKNEKEQLGGFVVFLSDDEELPARLKEVARQRKLERVVLSVDDPAGPEGFKVAEEAEVTVVLYREHAVKANHAFRKDELKEKSAAAILADLPKILAE